MKISKTHKKFADRLRNPRSLEHPEEFLGPNWKDVLNFWFFLDTLNEEQMKSINNAYYSLSYYEHYLALDAAWDVAWLAADPAAGDAAWAVYVTTGSAAAYATCEIIGSHILKEQGKSLIFLPMVLNV